MRTTSRPQGRIGIVAGAGSRSKAVAAPGLLGAALVMVFAIPSISAAAEPPLYFNSPPPSQDGDQPPPPSDEPPPSQAPEGAYSYSEPPPNPPPGQGAHPSSSQSAPPPPDSPSGGPSGTALHPVPQYRPPTAQERQGTHEPEAGTSSSHTQAEQPPPPSSPDEPAPAPFPATSLGVPSAPLVAPAGAVQEPPTVTLGPRAESNLDLASSRASASWIAATLVVAALLTIRPAARILRRVRGSR